MYIFNDLMFSMISWSYMILKISLIIALWNVLLGPNWCCLINSSVQNVFKISSADQIPTNRSNVHLLGEQNYTVFKCQILQTNATIYLTWLIHI